MDTTVIQFPQRPPERPVVATLSPGTLTDSERYLIARFRTLEPDDQQLVWGLFDYLDGVPTEQEAR